MRVEHQHSAVVQKFSGSNYTVYMHVSYTSRGDKCLQYEADSKNILAVKPSAGGEGKFQPNKNNAPHRLLPVSVMGGKIK